MRTMTQEGRFHVEAAPGTGGMSALLERVRGIGEKTLKLHDLESIQEKMEKG